MSGLDSATPCLCVCVKCVVIPDLSALVLARFPTYYYSQLGAMAASVNRAEKKSGTSASVKGGTSIYSLHLSPLLLSVDLQIAFWYFFMTESKREDYFGISLFFLYNSLQKSSCF